MLQQMKSARGRGITVDTIRATMVAGRSLAWKVAAVALPAAVAFAGLAAVSSPSLAAGAAAWYDFSPSLAVAGPVATRVTGCSPGDRPETGLQGQTTLADGFASQPYSSGPARAFNCNLELVGQVTGDGATLGFQITNRCAYYSQWLEPSLAPVLKHPGVVVVDVTDPAHPKIAGYLPSPAMMSPNESLLVDHPRHLLVGQYSNQHKFGTSAIDIYDIADCRHPVLKFSGVIPGVTFHTGDFSRDGKILWTAPSEDLKSDTIYAIDVSDPAHPKVIAHWKPTNPLISRFHNVTVSDDGRIAYLDEGTHYPSNERHGPSQGMIMLDVSQVQERKPNPQIRMIGKPLFWTDVTHGQYQRVMTVKGRKYLWLADIDSAILPDFVEPTGRRFTGVLAARAYKNHFVSAAEECRENPGKSAWGYVSIIDVQDPLHPVRVSDIKLQVGEPKNCLAIAHDPSYSFAYAPRYCDVDDYQDARMMACSFTNSGIRVFDIRDIYHPREIAYYKPPAVGTAPRAASMYQTFRDTGVTWGEAKYHTVDATIYPFFAKGGREIWFTSFDNGFQVIRFSNELLTREKGLFDRDITCNGKLRGPHGCS